MTDTAGSSKLTPEQTDWYQARYGIRPTIVPDRPPSVPNRKARRLAKKGKRVAS